MHHHLSEHCVVVNGKVRIANGDNEILIQANESTYILAGRRHRLENPGNMPCVMIEVQCGACQVKMISSGSPINTDGKLQLA